MGQETQTLINERYQLVQRLAEHGCCELWLAKDTQQGHRVLVSRVPQKWHQHPQARTEFELARQRLGSLQHPAAAKLIEAGEWPDAYVVHERLEGQTLTELMATGPYPISWAVSITLQAARVLAEAAEHGLIMQPDPNNLALTEQGQLRVGGLWPARVGEEARLATQLCEWLAQLLIGAGVPAGERASALASLPPAIQTLIRHASRYKNLRELASGLEVALASVSSEGEAAASVKKKRKPLLIGIAAVVCAVAVGFGAGKLTLRSNEVTVPGLVGHSIEQARSLAAEHGFSVAVMEQPSDRPKGEVLAQYPRASAKLTAGQELALTVSSGAKPIRIPAFTGKRADEAERELVNLGLKVTRKEQATEEVAPGHVINTNPQPGSEVQPGSQIELLVSKAKTVKLPRLVGLSQNKAEKMLLELGLTPEIDTRESERKQGTVISQSPSAKARVQSGERVKLVVSEGQGSYKLEDFTGQSLEKARAALIAQGLKVVWEYRSTSKPSRLNMVLEQTPQPGHPMQEGEVVLLAVGTRPGDKRDDGVEVGS